METSAALTSVLVSYTARYAIWRDNGSELQGEFEKLWQRLKIKHITTNPYGPEQNGKCERFWPTIEMSPTRQDVPALIEEYNETSDFGPRASMRQSRKSRLTPKGVWKDKNQHWGEAAEPAYLSRLSSPALRSEKS
jgi:transposase InsO family protein